MKVKKRPWNVKYEIVFTEAATGKQFLPDVHGVTKFNTWFGALTWMHQTIYSDGTFKRVRPAEWKHNNGLLKNGKLPTWLDVTEITTDGFLTIKMHVHIW